MKYETRVVAICAGCEQREDKFMIEDMWGHLQRGWVSVGDYLFCGYCMEKINRYLKAKESQK